MSVLEKQPTEQQAAVAFEISKRIETNVKALRTLWVAIAEDLHKFHELEMWRDLGYMSFEAWLAEPTIDLSRRKVYYLLEAWRELVVKRGVKAEQLQAIEISKVQEVLPAIRREHVKVDQALSDAETLAGNDLRERYRNMGTTKPGPEASTSYDAGAEPSFAICPSCGSRYRVKASTT